MSTGATDVPVGRVLAGRYRIDSLIARGGMGRVYRAADQRLDRSVAVKVLAAPYAQDPAFVERFLAEARTAASFSHPNLAHVYDSGTDGELRFMVLELLDSHRSLRDELRARGNLPAEEAVRIVRDVLAGLAPLHERGLIHCDVKAGNVMVGPGGTKLIDFGIARPLQQATAGATSIGSLHTMSPEQLRGDGLTPASDMFAVGVVLFEALSGHVPFPGDTPAAVLDAQAAGPVGRPSDFAPDIPSRLDDAVLQALQLDPARRFRSAEAMATALEAALAGPAPGGEIGEDTTAVVTLPPRADPQPRAQPPPRRRWGTGALAVVALLAAPALVAAIVLAGLADPDPRATPGATGQPSGTPTLAPGTVRVPDTIGMSEQEAEAAAREAGLNWRIEWRIDPQQSPGIYDQEPSPGRVVESGSRFVMYAYRDG